MEHKYKFSAMCVALLLAFGLLFLPGAANAAYAAEGGQALNETSILNVLAALEIMNGDESGSLNLSSPVTRAEFTKMVLAASSAKDAVESQSSFSPYGDVTRSHWAAGYIKTARDMGLISGYLDGTFKPDDGVKLAEAVTVALKNLGYTEADFAGSYPTGQMSLYHSLSLDDGLSLNDADAGLTRRDCAYLIYNMLNAKTKSGNILADTLGYNLDASGKIDYLSLLNDKISGPFVVADSSWVSRLGFEPTTVYRNDAASSSAAVQVNDVIYYSSGMRTVWAYNKQRTGTYESAAPDRTSPSSVTISGVQYNVGSSEAAYALSVLGGHSLGETLTVLLGRDDSIVAILGASGMGIVGNPTANSTTEICGIIVGTGTKNYSDSSGNDRINEYIQVMATDGQTYDISTNKGYNVGALVKVRTINGNSTISGLNSNTRGQLSGTVNADATRIGNRELAANAEILDIYQSNGTPVRAKAVKLHRSRLAGTKLQASDVLYWEQDEDGYISKLVLKNFSGDLFTYGILQKAEEDGSSGSYEYISNGQVQKFASGNVSYNVNRGAFGMLNIDGNIVSIRNLSGVSVASIDSSNSITDSGGQSWLLSDSAQIYESRSGEYYQTSLNLLNTQNYTLRAYYDQGANSCGRIRIIIATAN